MHSSRSPPAGGASSRPLAPGLCRIALGYGRCYSGYSSSNVVSRVGLRPEFIDLARLFQIPGDIVLIVSLNIKPLPFAHSLAQLVGFSEIPQALLLNWLEETTPRAA